MVQTNHVAPNNGRDLFVPLTFIGLSKCVSFNVLVTCVDIMGPLCNGASLGGSGDITLWLIKYNVNHHHLNRGISYLRCQLHRRFACHPRGSLGTVVHQITTQMPYKL